jgi:dTDP-4-dehydrorhamnose 3,5-epimerase
LKFSPTPLAGAFVVELERIEDDRGFFARSFCEAEFRAQGLNPAVTQCNVSWNRRKGTLRGLHFQSKPHEEAKLVRCTRGAVWDVLVDLRDNSPTRLRWHALDLSSDNRLGLYIPEGFAHGFQTLQDDSEVLYQMTESHHPECARGVPWNDPRLAIAWPLADPILSERDRSYQPLP